MVELAMILTIYLKCRSVQCNMAATETDIDMNSPGRLNKYGKHSIGESVKMVLKLGLAIYAQRKEPDNT